MQLIKKSSLLLAIALFSIFYIDAQAAENRSKEIIDSLTKYDFESEDDSIQKNIENINVAVVNRPKEPEKPPMSLNWGNLTGKVQIKYKPESFYGKNVHMLNNNVDSDCIMFSRCTFDFNVGLDYGKACYGDNILNFYATMRNKSTWGVPESVARTTPTPIKTLDSLDSGHIHFFTRQIMWIREAWLRFSINDAFGLSFGNKHYFTVGAFPFELGRGISLGAAYAVNPGPLGFFSDNSIDQFAYGFKFNGDIVESKLAYDIYGSVLSNKGDSFSKTAENIYGQRFDYKLNPERGARHMNFIVASRLRWFPVQSDLNTLIVEPYFFVGKKPELKVQFEADSSAVLGTLGLATELVLGDFEFGFDAARNIGKQVVFGWDRNKVDRENYQSFFSVINSDVLSEDPTTVAKPAKVAYVPGSDAQKLIDATPQDTSQNGMRIGSNTTTVPDPRNPTVQIPLYNSLSRFRNPYSNSLEGWMAVCDGAYWFCDRQLRIAAGAGVASGDEDPNVNLDDPANSKVDGNYKGFIGLQEIYTGNRIQSVFLLGGAGKIPRPLSAPVPYNQITMFPTLTSGFTNLVFTGASLYWTSKGLKHNFEFRPNILAYWQQHATKKFDRVTKMSSSEYARNYLGIEINTFFNVVLIKDFSFFAVGSVFIPGGHFYDIKGTPLNKEQKKFLDRVDVSGNNLEEFPLLGASPAWTINVGLEFRF